MTKTRPGLFLMRRLRPVRGCDEGSLMLYMLPISVILLLFAGLVLDGGTALATRGRASDVAEQAARSAANALSQASLRASGPARPRIDPIEAQAAGQRVLRDGGATGRVAVRAETGEQVVTVTAHLQAHTVILSVIGITDASASVTANATIVTGTYTPSTDPPSDGANSPETGRDQP